MCDDAKVSHAKCMEFYSGMKVNKEKDKIEKTDILKALPGKVIFSRKGNNVDKNNVDRGKNIDTFYPLNGE